ncbi:phosphatidylinositol-glycan biosynthesis class W -like [Brachionus plicatilis]|uniref:Phosphatidylinositol-glycan biosynthesis class W-like n=1 Tax=Brachionus plicatilis TaxID=10195 RepID=A0A3M7S239_BRAPC|nr:phosphatidylinositol-glycan biosynthesis class W -like [Brachionus plicatilis]
MQQRLSTSSSSNLVLYFHFLPLFTLKNFEYFLFLDVLRNLRFLRTKNFLNVLASPFDCVIKGSSKKAFFISLFIGVVYQSFLMIESFSDYLLEYDKQRTTLIDKNKEGIFSTIGYISLYFFGESICYELKRILNNREAKNDHLAVSKKCGFTLLVFSIIFFIFTHLNSAYIQDVSRRICNLSFIFYTSFLVFYPKD